MRLTDRDRALLAGEHGVAPSIAMSLVVAAAEAVGAAELLDISAAHVDSCLYHGQASLDFAERLAAADARVVVPTSLNVSSLDLLHPDLYQGDAETASRASRLMDCYVALGCRPTWTCAPYQLAERPGLGDQIAWGESNAIVFANSVLGARTERYGDFLDISCALTGRAPAVGLHTDAGRRATLRVDLDVPGSWLDEDLLYVALGHYLGRIAGTEVAVIDGLDNRADEDRLKALGAAAASSGAVGMFHAAGVTPEAPTAEAALGHGPPRRVMTAGVDEIAGALAELGASADRLGAVSIGTPHASLRELESLAGLCRGRHSRVPFYVNTGRDTLATAGTVIRLIEEFGATFVTDTCNYVTPIMTPLEGAVMTNSGKWAYYAPANIGVDVVMGSLSDCVESAASGHVVTRGWPR